MRNDDDKDIHWPSWSKTDDAGKFFYVMAAILAIPAPFHFLQQLKAIR